MTHEEERYLHLPLLASALQKGRDPYPRVVEIHPTDLCNHRCDYCFHGGVGYDPRRKSEVLSLDAYCDLFREMHELGIGGLSVAGGGEPFVDGRLGDILDAAQDYDLRTRIVTHGNLVSGEVLNHLIACCEIRFSIDAIHPTTYEAIRHVNGQLLHQTLLNIRRLVELRNRTGSGLVIGVTFLICRSNVLEVGDFCVALLAIGVDSIILKYNIYGDAAIPVTDMLAVATAVREVNDPRVELRRRSSRRITGLACYAPHLMVATNPYGDVYSCALGSQPGEANGYLLGNLRTQRLRDLWNESRKLRTRMRRLGVACVHCNHSDVSANGLLDQALADSPFSGHDQQV